jgi:guanylate kinase
VTWYVLITGTTTAGKTTLLRSLRTLLEESVVVPLATCRPERPDDNPAHFRFYSESEFEQQAFIARYAQYGILQQDVDSLASQEGAIGLCITGARELAQLKGKLPLTLETLNILVRHTSDAESEIQVLQENVKRYFPESEWQQRFSAHARLIEEAFFNQAYIDQNIDLVLDRGATLAEWLKEVSGRLLSRPAVTFEQVASTILNSAKR